MDRRIRHARRAALLLTFVALGASCSAKTANTTRPSSLPGHTASSATPTTLTADTARSRAEAIMLSADDLPSGVVPDGSAPTPIMRQAASACHPVSSAPWLAALDSPTFSAADATGTVDIQAQVDILPTESVARALLAKVADPTYGTRCRLPANDDDTTLGIDETDSQSACGLSFEGSSIVNLRSATLANGAVGTRYIARIHCDATKQTVNAYHDQIGEQVGNTYIALSFATNPRPPDRSLEVRLLRLLADRARSAAAG